MKSIQNIRQLPDYSLAAGILDHTDYADSYRIRVHNCRDYSIDYITTAFFSISPAWMDFLLNLRNTIVKPFGLKMGKHPSFKNIDRGVRYEIGEKAGFFHIVKRNGNEIVMSEHDRHLDFVTSVIREDIPDTSDSYIYSATLVKYNNFFGSLYFMPVRPFHKLIIRTSLRMLKSNLEKQSVKIIAG